MRIGTIGMHEMPEILAGNLRRLGYDAEYIDGGLKAFLRRFRAFNILIVIFPINKLKLIILAKVLGLKVIACWIGTDCLMAQSNPHKMRVKLASPFIDHHIADAPHLKDELRQINIKSTFIPIIPEIVKPQPLPMPDEFKVITYIMPERPEFYGASMVGEIARSMPEVEFIITEEGRVPGAPPNVKHLGFIPPEEMEGLYRDTSVFLRLTVHDGISKSVLESLAFGRYVIRTIDFPACFKATTADEVVEILKSLRDVREPNMEGVKFIEDELNYEVIGKRWEEVFEEVRCRF